MAHIFGPSYSLTTYVPPINNIQGGVDSNILVVADAVAAANDDDDNDDDYVVVAVIHAADDHHHISLKLIKASCCHFYS